MYKVAIIGAGNIAKTVHIPTYQRYSWCDVVAISDVNDGLLHETADTFHITRRFADYQTMIDEMKPDIVSICTPNRFHAEQSIYALTHGAHVFCEKPPALSVDEFLSMHQAAKRHERIIAFNFHHRYRTETQEMKKWVERQHKSSIYFGEIFALRRKGVPGWGSFTQKTLSGGGPLIDLGVHMLDLALYVLGSPKVTYVTATMSSRIGRQGGIGDMGAWNGSTFTVEDSLFGQIVFQDGTSIHLQTAFTHHMQSKSMMNVKLYAKDEAIELSPYRIISFDHIIDEHESIVPAGLSALPYFLKKINGEPVDIPDIQSTLLTQQILDALYLSATTLKPIYLGDSHVSL